MLVESDGFLHSQRRNETICFQPTFASTVPGPGRSRGGRCFGISGHHALRLTEQPSGYCHYWRGRAGWWQYGGGGGSAAEVAARALGAERLYTEASELARPVFARAGYALLSRRDFTIPAADGAVAIHNYAMEKRLT